MTAKQTNSAICVENMVISKKNADQLNKEQEEMLNNALFVEDWAILLKNADKRNKQKMLKNTKMQKCKVNR